MYPRFTQRLVPPSNDVWIERTARGGHKRGKRILADEAFALHFLEDVSELIMQLFAGVDVPHKDSVVYPPGAPAAAIDRVYILGVRLVFDWRRYF